jgi:hypothetical protein
MPLIPASTPLPPEGKPHNWLRDPDFDGKPGISWTSVAVLALVGVFVFFVLYFGLIPPELMAMVLSAATGYASR